MPLHVTWYAFKKNVRSVGSAELFWGVSSIAASAASVSPAFAATWETQRLEWLEFRRPNFEVNLSNQTQVIQLSDEIGRLWLISSYQIYRPGDVQGGQLQRLRPWSSWTKEADNFWDYSIHSMGENCRPGVVKHSIHINWQSKMRPGRLVELFHNVYLFNHYGCSDVLFLLPASVLLSNPQLCFLVAVCLGTRIRQFVNSSIFTALFIQDIDITDITDITYLCSDCALENSRLESQTCHAAMPALNGATVKTKKCCVTIIPCHAYRTGSVLFWPLASRPATAEAELE